MLITLLPIILNVLLASLSAFGVNVPTNVTALIQHLIPVVEKLIADIRAGHASAATPTVETIGILQEMVPVIQAVRKDTSLSPIFTEWATLLEEMVVEVMLADADAQKAVDPSKLHVE